MFYTRDFCPWPGIRSFSFFTKCRETERKVTSQEKNRIIECPQSSNPRKVMAVATSTITVVHTHLMHDTAALFACAVRMHTNNNYRISSTILTPWWDSSVHHRSPLTTFLRLPQHPVPCTPGLWLQIKLPVIIISIFLPLSFISHPREVWTSRCITSQLLKMVV